MKILIINGPNLNLLGKRNPDVYGSKNLDDLKQLLQDEFQEHSFEFLQSNHEGEIIEAIQNSTQNDIEAIVANFGGYSHTSVAIRDALELISIPKIEVHISNIHAREEYRERSITAKVMNGVITGFGFGSYILGVKAAELTADV